MIAPIVLAACAIGGVSAQCGTATVPEDRAVPNGPQITLKVAVLPATDRARRRADPVFWISGGPGGVASEEVPFVARMYVAANTHRDVVFVDQRGVGGSSPLACKVATGGTDVAALVRECLGQITADVTHYRTPDAMDDLEDVRQALGYGQIDVWGGSYGATAAQVFLRRHPLSVRTIVIDGPTLLDVPVFERWASSAQRALVLLDRRCRADASCRRAFPHWFERFPSLLAKLAKKPVAGFDAAAVAGVVDELTATQSGASLVPHALARAEAGNFQPLKSARATLGDGGDRQAPAMYWAIVCTETWAVRDPARALADARGTYMRYAVERDVVLQNGVCAAWPKLDASSEDWSRVRSETPGLVLVGGSDPKDPPGNTAGVTQAMPNAKVITVPGGAHGVSFVGCLPRIVDAFLEAGTARGLDTACVSLTPYPSFRLR
ncbi:MAG TPA: alpha/beta fold hydrolase [Gaiellaceae bacterium]|nr:alpha/beta fold hydrolase [Gaiellaceae bacterium]